MDENHNLYTLLSASCTSRVESSKVATIAETRSYDSDSRMMKEAAPPLRKRQENSPAVPQPNENSQALLLSADMLPVPATDLRTSTKSIHLSSDTESRLVTIYIRNIEDSQMSSPENDKTLARTSNDLEIQPIKQRKVQRGLLQTAEKPCGYSGMF